MATWWRGRPAMARTGGATRWLTTRGRRAGRSLTGRPADRHAKAAVAGKVDDEDSCIYCPRGRFLGRRKAYNQRGRIAAAPTSTHRGGRDSIACVSETSTAEVAHEPGLDVGRQHHRRGER